MLKAVCKPTQPDAAPPELIFNTDVTTMVLSLTKEKVLVSSDLRRHMRNHNLNVATTATIPKGRSVGLMPTVAADGRLLCLLVFIKDDKYPEPKLFRVHIHTPTFI